MESQSDSVESGFAAAAEELSALRQFSGERKEFWNRLLAVTAKLASAEVAVLLMGNPGNGARWGKIGEWTDGKGTQRTRAEFAARLEEVADCALRDGRFVRKDDEALGAYSAAVRLQLARPEEQVVLAVLLTDFTEAAARQSLLNLSLVADTPRLYYSNLASRQAGNDVEKFAAVLDLIVPVNAATQFLSAQLAFCNGIASRFGCERASLGWIEGGYVHLRAMSRTEQFDRKMAAAQALESAMEECVDQDEEILWPLPTGVSCVTRDHERYGSEQKTGHLCSVPMRLDEKVVAVLTCERQKTGFQDVELHQLRLSCDQVVRRLSDLKRLDRWFGARWAALAKERFAAWLGPEHTWSKVSAIAGVVLFAALFLVRVNYRVEGNMILRSDEAAYLTAPFDGYVDEVFVRAGDRVPKGGKLVTLNRRELYLEESNAIADLTRYSREAEKARAVKALADMRIAEALAQQAQARLDLIRHRLDAAVIKSMFEAVVVEGDLRERIAAPVKLGDSLFKVARLDSLYAEAEIDERDAREILGKSGGEIALITQPKLKYPVTIQTVEPAAVPKKEGNVFLVRLKLDRGADSWWRPGMTGLCKLDVGKRSLFWILTHRTVDFLRMKLWW